MKVVVVVGLLVACGTPERSEPTERAPTERVPIARAPIDAPTEVCKRGATECSGDDVMMCEGGTLRRIAACRGGCRSGACVETCGANDVEQIYVVEGGLGILLSFDPRRLPADPFKAIGRLTCESSETPNSMAVDRTGIAWVGYTSGRLHQVSLLDANCFSQSGVPAGAPSERFGMGFVTDGPNAKTEKLYVVEYGGESQVATIDTSVFPTEWVRRGKLGTKRTTSPELSGTSEGRLYGYFPGEKSRGYIQELARNGAAIGRRWELPAGTGEVGGWAFAFWGGVFYVFVTFKDNNEVHAINRKTGKHELVLAEGEHRIVGAGVSTCAPLLEKPL